MDLLRTPIEVDYDQLRLDPNNPRLAPDDAPGYADAEALLDPDRQVEVRAVLETAYKPEKLREAIITQGWLPIDSIVVWEHPDRPGIYVVVEGNTRTLALSQIRDRVAAERQKLERMQARANTLAEHTLQEQRARVAQFDAVIAETNRLHVVPLAADSAEDLEHVLPRVLAVRHITTVKGWGNYAEDLWLLRRYHHLYEDIFPGQPFRWEQSVIKKVADEASLGPTTAKRQIKAASLFSSFKANHEDELPEDAAFKPTDYYLFENVVRRPAIRDLFGLGEDDLALSPDAERTLFEWTFRLPRDEKDEEGNGNPNVFYRHENLAVLDQMKRYDDTHKTSFAARFDPATPDDTPSMRAVEAEWRTHMARKKPQDVLDQLARQLDALDASIFRHEGEFLKTILVRVRDTCDDYVAMIKGAEARHTS